MLRSLLVQGFLPLLALQGGAVAPASAPQSQYGLACPAATASPVELLKKAQALRDERQFEPAMHCFARAADEAERAGDAATEAQARLTFGLMAYDRSAYDLSATAAARARALFSTTDDRHSHARATRLLGSIALMRGDRPEALREYTAALGAFTAIDDVRGRISMLTDLARLKSGDAGIPLLDEAVALARKAVAPDLEGTALHVRSDRHFASGRFDAAIDDLLRAITLFKDAGEQRPMSDAYVSLGRIMRAHGRFEEALAYYDRAIEIQQSGGDVRGRVQSFNAKAVALGHLGRKAESRAAYERALELAKQTGSERLINFQQGNLASSYGDAGDYPAAIRLLEDVLTRETDPFILAYRHGLLGWYLQLTKESSRAASHVETSIELAKSTDNRDLLPTLYYRAAVIYQAQGRPDAALAAASDGVQVIEDVRARLVPLDFMKRGFSEQWQALYGLTIGLLHSRGEHERALATSELARARAFLDLLASRNLADRVSPSLAALGAAGARGPGSLAAASTSGMVDITATAVRTRSTIVSYWVGAGELLIWVAPPEGNVRAARVAIERAELEKLVEASVPAAGRPTAEALQRLDALLVEPVRQWLPATGEALTIVPHGPLFRVSFAALRGRGGPYLVERYVIAYAPSISTLAATRSAAEAKGPQAHGRYVIVADPSPLPAGDKVNPALASLPGALREASAIVGVIGAERASILAGADASEAEVTRAGRDTSVLHFATHGVIRDDAPFDSFLALSAAGSGEGDDGRLTVRELYDVRLNADLVVLSACRTATGAPSGDGITGLSRALFYAGARSVLATLWDVADEPSATLMAAFYKHLRSGLDKRAALRAAQLELLQSLRAGKLTVRTRLGVVPLQEQPFYWAAYVFVGEP